MERSELQIEGRTVTVISAGRPPAAAPSILMLPGLGYPGMLGPWMKELSRWARVSVLDLPGWRKGRPVSCPPTVAGVADATVRVLHRSTEPPILIGHSTGAQAALKAAVLAPDRIAGLVLTSPTVDPTARHWPGLVRAYGRRLWRESPSELLAVRKSMAASGIGPIRDYLRSAIADRPELDVPRLRVPSLIMTGRHDLISPPAWCERLARAAGCRFEILPGAHNCCFTHPAAAEQAVRKAARTW